MAIKYIDLFAGCGGISLGLYKSGLQGLFAVEKSPDAFLTFKYNLIDKQGPYKWPEWLPIKNWEINTLLAKVGNRLQNLYGKVDLVVGGPPCQGFSMAGEHRASDNRNKLILSYLEFVEIIRPKVIMFENVRGFTFTYSNSKNHTRIPYSEIVINKLQDLGYKDARGEMVDMFEYGVPQHRKRFIVIATREGLAGKIFSDLKDNREQFLKARGIQANNNTKDAISDLEYKHGSVRCPDSKNFMSGKIASSFSSYQNYLRISGKETYIPNSHRFVNHKVDTVNLFSELLNKAPRNKCITGKERGLYGIKKRYLTVLDPNQPSPTVTTIPDDFIHYSEPRVMTVRECARLQTFPDWFEFKGSYTTGNKARVKSVPRYTQVGNAVPPLFAEQVGLAIRKALLDK